MCSGLIANTIPSPGMILNNALSLSGGSVRMIMQSSLTDMEHLNVSAITTTKTSAIEWASSGRTVALVPMDAKEMVNHRKNVTH